MSVNRFSHDDLLDRFLPLPEVDECHRILVSAPTGVTFAAARELDIQSSPVVRGIFMLRTIPTLLRGEPLRYSSRGLLAETLSIGWGVLTDLPDREIVVGAVTQPWEPVVTFHPLPPEEFAAFNTPGYAKIVWTLAAEPLGPNESMFITRTRVSTTDPLARERFRRYWAMFSPGILIIRYAALWLSSLDLLIRWSALPHFLGSWTHEVCLIYNQVTCSGMESMKSCSSLLSTLFPRLLVNEGTEKCTD